MSEVIDFLMKTKKTDGTYDVLHPITKTANVKTATEIEVMLNGDATVGSFKNGDTVAVGTSVDSIIKKMLQQQIPPVYTQPTVSITLTSGNNGGSFEEGTNVSPAFSGSFTVGDSGGLTKIAIKKNNTEVATSATSPVSHSETFAVSGTTTFKATATYDGGATKQDNFGEDYPTGKINAGSKDSSTITYTSYRNYWYGSDNVATAPASSAEVRAIPTASGKNAAAGTKFTINVAAGQTRATFAYPASLRDVNTVRYEEGNDNNYSNFFTKSTVAVEGANGFTPIDYKVYTYIPAAPFPAKMTFIVTI